MKMHNVKQKIILVVGLLVLVIPLFTIKWSGGEYSASEKRNLANFPQLTVNGILNKSFPHDMINWLEDHIGFRNSLVKLSANVKLNILGLSPSPQVHIGKEGWYYYTQDSNLEISTGNYPLDAECLESILQHHLRIRDKLLESGIEYVVVLPVSKVSIYPEYMRYGSEQVRITPVDIVADYLEEHSDLHVIRLKEDLLASKETAQTFFKTDTHWNQYGAYVACRKIISDMTAWGLCSTPFEYISFEDGIYLGEFGAMMGSAELLGWEPTQNIKFWDQNAVKNQETSRYRQLMDIVSGEAIYNPTYYYTNDSVKQRSVLMFGDSMFGSWQATELLAEHFSEFTYIWNYDIRQSIIDYINPDVVIYEMTERYLNTFPQHCSDYIKNPLNDYHAKIQSVALQDDTLTVTVKNDSEATWTEIDQIKCGLFLNGVDSGMRATLSPDQNVGPNETVTFKFQALDNWLNESPEVQMLQEGVCYFGERRGISGLESGLDAEVISHTTPSVVNHTDSYTFDITVKNTGSVDWSESQQIRFCIWQDGVDHGYRLLIPDGVTVAPGEEYTFTLEGFVLPEADSTYLEFQMLQEGVRYFGEKERVNITATSGN